MTTLFSSKDIKTVAREVFRRQDWEGCWTDENGKVVDMEEYAKKVLGEGRMWNISPLDWAQLGIQLFVDELNRRFPADSEDVDYFSDDTPRLDENREK